MEAVRGLITVAYMTLKHGESSIESHDAEYKIVINTPKHISEAASTCEKKVSSMHFKQIYRDQLLTIPAALRMMRWSNAI